MWVVVAVLLAVIIAVAIIMLRRNRSSMAVSNHAPIAAGAADVAPMTDLEAALDQVADSSGRSMRDEIDAQTEHVDQLRVADDTGPLLRRALDSVTDDADDDGTTPTS